MDPPAKKTKKPLRQEVKELRKQLGQKRIGGGLATQHLYVTHCANEPLGAAKKYPRLGPVETMEIQDTSIEGIKAACLNFFSQQGKEPVLMKNDRGFKVTKIEQLNLKNPFCVRFDPPKVQSEPAAQTPAREVPPRHPLTEVRSMMDSSAPVNLSFRSRQRPGGATSSRRSDATGGESNNQLRISLF